MSRFSGVWKIVRFNWPWYLGAVAATLAGIFLIRSEALGAPWSALAAAGLFAADFWLLVSLAVSHHVYDRSPLSRGAWLDEVDPVSVRTVAVFHGGQDEATGFVARTLPSAEILTFDFYHPGRNGSSSLKRARALATRRAICMLPGRIPLPDRALDLALMVFAAHEIRKDTERKVLFSELARVLAPSGRALVVEHLRDAWNFLAYGPGAFHFLTKAAWSRTFSDSELHLFREIHITPFVRVFELGTAP